MEAEWVSPAGRREVPGRPLIYRTTDAFLQHFGLTSRKDLPGIEDLRAAGLLDPVDLAFEEALGELDLVKDDEEAEGRFLDRKSRRLYSSHYCASRMPTSA